MSSVIHILSDQELLKRKEFLIRELKIVEHEEKKRNLQNNICELSEKSTIKIKIKIQK
jgi:hypothetical protein